jgi:phage replication-related protein YjqB (UPF0714/DUF867 family)
MRLTDLFYTSLLLEHPRAGGKHGPPITPRKEGGNHDGDDYGSWEELAAAEAGNYAIETKNRNSPISVIAIHGGDIEFGTDKIARAIAAAGGFNYYAFIAYAGTEWKLHITSTKATEPKLVSMVQASDTVISVHGKYDHTGHTFMGGRNTTLGSKIKQSLIQNGFPATDAPARLSGKSTKNICNRCASGAGVQLEVSTDLRIKLAANSTKYAEVVVQGINS